MTHPTRTPAAKKHHYSPLTQSAPWCTLLLFVLLYLPQYSLAITPAIDAKAATVNKTVTPATNFLYAFLKISIHYPRM